MSLSQRAYEELREKILNNELKPGRFFLEKELAELLGISRTPLKEALVKLENEGLIKVQPRHGMQVLPLSADDMQEVYQIITALECEAVSVIANKGLQDEEIGQLEQTGIAMAEALERDDLEAWAKADEDFHRLLLAFCGNARLKQTVLNYWDLAHRARYFTLQLRDKPVNSTLDHQQVIEAIKHKDPQKAVSIHRQHRVNGGASLVRIIRQYRLDHL
ncbi:GntR family transcriptional regulator [Alteromonas aestuariivivens]|uniref:GntR family transcriptional regulator n=1 Tax=Alteromonas aestuariivivens TaxID=1938339 RepID=A0A3D8MEW3_9ALTE|nr:GntR family transcriptional regulator [Alteromonas aestuariivivens]RDV29140.1 GntR family transcriptional regulator [Alteromonas aestuariivivens]